MCATKGEVGYIRNFRNGFFSFFTSQKFIFAANQAF